MLEKAALVMRKLATDLDVTFCFPDVTFKSVQKTFTKKMRRLHHSLSVVCNVDIIFSGFEKKNYIYIYYKNTKFQKHLLKIPKSIFQKYRRRRFAAQRMYNQKKIQKVRAMGLEMKRKINL